MSVYDPLFSDSEAMPTDEVDVLVAVVTFNSERVLAGLIESLPPALAECSWRLVVADNDSHDGTLAMVRDLAPQATIVEMGRNAGYAAGINAAIAAGGKSDSVLILNADTRLEPKSVPTLRKHLDRPGVSIVVPRLINENGVMDTSLRREPNLRRSLGDTFFGGRRMGRFHAWGETITTPSVYEREATGDWATGAALLVSRDCVEAVGPWDESFFLYSEETEYFLRARDLGHRLLYTPEVTAIHLGGDSHVSAKLRSLLVVNRIKLYSRTHSSLATLAFWFVAVLREASRAALGRRLTHNVLLTLLSPRRMRQARERAAS